MFGKQYLRIEKVLTFALHTDVSKETLHYWRKFNGLFGHTFIDFDSTLISLSYESQLFLESNILVKNLWQDHPYCAL